MENLEDEVADDLGQERAGADEHVLQVERVDPQGHIVDVDEADAEGRRQPVSVKIVIQILLWSA